MPNSHNQISYIEFPARDLNAAKRFYSELFGWSFTDYGEEYVAFEGAGVAGGFYLSGLSANASEGSALVVLYSEDLEASQAQVEATGGHIKVDIFAFPGGRRFHFTDPNDNELAIWSDQ